MDTRRAPQGLHAEDRVALGLSATHLFYLVSLSMSGWAVLTSNLLGIIRFPLGSILIGGGIALAWLRVAGRPLDRWVVLYLAYRARPRAGFAAQDPPPTVTPEYPASPRIVALPTRQQRDWEPERGGIESTGVRAVVHRARRCAFFSYRGGTGKSALASEVAAQLASLSTTSREGAPRIALLDVDQVSSSLVIRLGLAGPTFAEILSASVVDPTVIEGALLRHHSGARVLLAAPSANAALDVYSGSIPRLSVVLAYLDAQQFDVVLFDMHGTIGDLESYVLETADEIYYVATPTACGIHDLYRGVAQLKRLGHRGKIRVVLNQCPPYIDLGEVIADLRLGPFMRISSNREIADAENSHLSASLISGEVAASIRELSVAVYPDAGFGDRVGMPAAASWSTLGATVG